MVTRLTGYGQAEQPAGVHCLVGTGPLCDATTFHVLQQRLCFARNLGAKDLQRLPYSQPREQVSKSDPHLVSPASSPMHRVSRELQRLACHMGESRSCPCWEAGTLAKAGGAEFVRKGETVSFTLTLSLKTAKGQSRLAQG